MTASSEGSCDRGVFITFEGGDGAGKTTHIAFLARALSERGHEVVRVREPGGTPVGEKLRSIVLDPENEELCPAAELLIYEAARAQIVAQVIAPALSRGAVVLCDRFYDSTVAYQAYGRGLSRSFVDTANEFACQGVRPDRTILIDAGSTSRALFRATAASGADRLEREPAAFHDRVNAAFAEIARAHEDRIRVVPSRQRKRDTARGVFRALSDLFPWMADERICDDAFFSRIERGVWR